MTPERKVKAKVRSLLIAHNVWFFMPIPMYNRGIPDFICCLRGKFIGIETKAGRGKLSELQRLTLLDIERAGGYVLVVNEDNLSSLEELLKELHDCASE